jgi:hypothetical protein
MVSTLGTFITISYFRDIIECYGPEVGKESA